ncbi:DUF6883 domain-containing protein [Gloeocapsa sp. PCC 73106]|uniref:DUF6883 domain-containing protein n=1 Tax=Gloeocapsa sp. PCC 73106 TaxID=102232 RepID=UPI0002ACAC27|nr:DUF6883 domain-containing protein [Gloeocapsa sp. PCC 73106]ELR98447.1 hypothetical protein GLO73106DRAFT_00022800 [Gloeocapsa sp. PCC 73106]
MKLGEIVKKILIDPRKLIEYTLNLDNPKGANKAVMFERHLSFTKDNYELLLEQIYNQVLEAEATFQLRDKHGDRYQVDIEINGAKAGQREVVRTGWIVEPGSDTARLITLYVRKRL